jgi:hypothetical protein
VAFHGNNPAGGVRCAVCDGTGQVEVTCNHCGDAGAVEWFQGDPLCVACATVAMEEETLA